ncbi:MAG: hypothetical protein BroJett040_00040 [Oligoflexia bacterium]|nr:MAG: hypothetical protein BroJett040_00040 [Oligoflexia bacterium]
MKLRHILVQHDYEIEDLQRHLQKGQNFEELARKYSKCSSARAGGDLGDLTKKMDRLDESFREVAETLKINEIKKARSRFGYHLIQRYG